MVFSRTARMRQKLVQQEFTVYSALVVNRRCNQKTSSILPAYTLFSGGVHYVGGEIWKRRFISTVRPTFHTNPLQKRGSSKMPFKPEEFRNSDFAKTELFQNDVITIMMRFPCRSLPQTQTKMTGDCCVFESLRRSVDGKYLMHFQSNVFFQIPPA